MVDLEQGSSPAEKVLKFSLTPFFKFTPLEWIASILGFASTIAFIIYIVRPRTKQLFLFKDPGLSLYRLVFSHNLVG
jgi:hypothetical protein